MRPTLALLLAMALVPGFVVHAHAQDAAVYVVTYIEVAPSATGQGLALLKEYGAATRKDEGNLRVQVAQELGRTSRFVALEAWKDQKAFEAHGKAAHTVEFRQKLAAIHVSPYDERVHGAFLVAAAMPAGARGGVWVVSHVDVPPPRKDDVMGLLKTLTEESRTDPGHLMFEVVQQTSRPNHFTVVEAWKGRKGYEAHIMAAPTKRFREKLTPMSGALYDERLYKAVD